MFDWDAVLRPFLDQSIHIQSVLTVECPDVHGTEDALVSSLTLGGTHIHAPVGPPQLGSATLAVGQFSGHLHASDLLLIPAEVLETEMTRSDAALPFRALAVLMRDGSADPDLGWRLQRGLFDRGFIAIGSAQIRSFTVRCFLASDAVQQLPASDLESRGHVAISSLTEGGRFANQLFRYACVKLYALRHGLTPAIPDWEGRALFGLNDRSCDGLTLSQLTFAGFAKDERRLWETSDPPINVDLAGYFQEIPECWRKHRELLGRIFRLRTEYSEVVDRLHDRLTDGGRRTLVAVHVRRGDYRMLQTVSNPWFRIVPERWYVNWLRTIWPNLRDPVLFVATDEPESVLPAFQEFKPVQPNFEIDDLQLPGHVRDFELLRRAGYLAICNSSFSRMAAILAPSGQQCVLPVFRTRQFVPYDPWNDTAFWERFADSWSRVRPSGRNQRIQSPGGEEELMDKRAKTEIVVDVTDLILYVLYHNTLSGIQRVQCELIRNLMESSPSQPVRFAALNERGLIGEVDGPTLLDLVDEARSDSTSLEQTRAAMRDLLHSAGPCTLRSQDVFLMLGAFWAVPGMGRLLQHLKNAGVTTGVFIHDIIPVTAPEYFETRDTKLFAKGVIEALTFADFILTTSEYNRAALEEHTAAQGMEPLPIHLVPLGHAFPSSQPAVSGISAEIERVVENPFVLCVGTIEIRKNPSYLFNIWKRMVRSRRADVPYLVFAGRKGWLIQDFFEQLTACGHLGGRIVILHDVTDVELELLYRKCVLTVFPSFVEGWGLPVGESLAHGKICLCSHVGGIPEIAPGLVDFIDPYNINDGYQKLLSYLDAPDLREQREREIAERFAPRSWKDAANDVLRSTYGLARQMDRAGRIAAIKLPAACYLPISNDAGSMPAASLDGRLSSDLICVSGWRAPEGSGVRPAGRSAAIRFRADEPAGCSINLVLRFSAQGRTYRMRVQSGSGAETEIELPAGGERAAVLACQVEDGQIVTATVSQLEAATDTDLSGLEPYWVLRGILYFSPKRVATEAFKKPKAAGQVETPSNGTGPAAIAKVPHQLEPGIGGAHLQVRPVGLESTTRAASFGAFLQSRNAYWPSAFTTIRDAPVFADAADRDIFYSHAEGATQPGKITDSIRLVRRTDQFVSTSRFSEGSVFDRSGVSRAFGYLHGAPSEWTPWLSKEADCVGISEEALAAAPAYDGSYLLFYNGNLHNYYHWVVEGLLCLDILSRSLGVDRAIRVPIPKSVDVAAVFDHRDTLRAVGLNTHEVVEITGNLIRVQEAIWIESDLVQTMPAPYLKDFQKRVAALYARKRGPRNRRILVARRGPTRVIQNLDQVEGLVSRFGFETVYLEGMSMRDQILLFQSAEFVIGAHGAGLANLLFCDPHTKVIELMPSIEMRPFFWLIAEKLDLIHGVLFCSSIPAGDFQSAVNVDVDKLYALIRMVDAHL